MNSPLRVGASSAFSLVEVVLALGVTTFCLVALIGLLSVGITSNRGTIEQTGATAVLSAAVADLNATPRTSPYGKATTSIQFGIAIPANPVSGTPASTTLFFVGNGQWSTTIQSSSVYRLTITPVVPAIPVTTPASGATRIATIMDLKATWPASVLPANAAGTAETSVSLNRN
jgi:uncharacterized protein (TIGR02598 family)